MSEKQFHMMAFVDFLRSSAGQQECIKAFLKSQKITLPPSAPRSPITIMIDQATGADKNLNQREREIADKFIHWTAKQYGVKYFPKDYFEQLKSPTTEAAL